LRASQSGPAPKGQAVHPFRAAIEAGDLAGALALLAEDVVFRSPVVFKPYHGRDAVAPILAGVVRVFEDFRYVREIGAVGARDHALLFEARVGDRYLEGCDFLHTADDGLIDEFAVMVRPLSAAVALAPPRTGTPADDDAAGTSWHRLPAPM
jgi:ketosteroid isomerase-like protein